MSDPVQPARRSCCLTDVTRLPTRRAASIGLALAGVALTACGIAGPESRTFTGPVTVISSTTVCIGAPNASGECFVKDRRTRSLRVSDCVRVTYVLHDSPGPSTASKIEHVEAGTHTGECPHQ